jgi:hypothetical protein
MWGPVPTHQERRTTRTCRERIARGQFLPPLNYAPNRMQGTTTDVWCPGAIDRPSKARYLYTAKRAVSIPARRRRSGMASRVTAADR